MTVVFVYSRRNQEATTLSYFDYVLAAFQARGALVLEETRFLATRQGQMVPHGDRIVNFYCDHLGEVWSRCAPQFRWNYAIDELATPDGRAYATKIKQCKEFDSSHTVVTYVSPRHLMNLERAGISHVGMPCCPPRIRPRTTKPRLVAAFGTYDPKTYPERTRIKDVLVRAMAPRNVHELITEGTEGEAYYSALDGYQLGVVDRAGYRDRFVNKYVEYGASHVLPVGDCPSYMPYEMKQAMVNTEGRQLDWVVSEIKRLLDNSIELSQRQEAYSDCVARNFNLLFHADRVLRTIAATGR